MPGYSTSNVISAGKDAQSAPDLRSSYTPNADKRHIDQIDVSGTPGKRPVILTNYLFDDFEDGNYTSNPTWTMTSNGNGSGAEDWTVYADPWTYTYGTVTHNGSGYLVGSDSDGGGALADEELEISFNTPGGSSDLTLYYWVHFRAYDPNTEYLEILVDGNQVDLVTAPDDTPVVGDRTVILDSYNDGASHVLTIHYYANYGYVGAIDDVVITDDPRPVGSCCNDATGACVDGVEQQQCPSQARWTEGVLCANLQPPCGTILGACCDDLGNCTQTTEQDCPGTWFASTSCDPNPCPPPPPCTLSCPTNGIPEGEPDCYNGYEDNYNGGCNSTPSVFSAISIGDTVCGIGGDYITNSETRRDTDWYELTVTTDNMLYFYGVAEFDLQLLIMDAGSGDCVDYSIIAAVVIPACSTGVVSAPVCPGTYWLWAGENDDNWVNCGSQYQIWTELGAPPTGACCVDQNCVATNTLCECDALGGNWYQGEDCAQWQCPILVDCEDAIWTNGLPPGNTYGSQCEYDYAFAAGTADDFVLPGTGTVDLQYIVAWVGFWNQPVGNPESTPADLEGMNLTIYANDPSTSAPGGKPLDPPDSACSHVELIPGGVVYTTQVPAGSFGYVDDGGYWRVMMPVSVTLDAGVTYWLEVEPILQPFGTYGQCGWIGTTSQQGAFAMQIFELLGTDPWTTITPNTDVAFCLIPVAGGACDYVVGDVNGSNNYNGLDVTYGVNFFKYGSPAPQCPPDCPPCSGWHYCGDVNGSCNFNGLDVTYSVNYFKFGSPAPAPCGDCPPGP